MQETRALGGGEKLEWLRLIRSENVGPITFRQLITRFGNAGDAIAAIPELARRGGSRRTIRVCPMASAKRELEEISSLGGRMIASCEPEYPRLLANISDAPPLITVFGHPHLLTQDTIAVVGARNGSANGIRIAETIARDLSKTGLIIASGLARGIDAAAHRGSVENGTIAVMAGGVDIVYPKENEALYRDIAARGALISEQPFGIKPQARHFPYRNRLVSGLALATVVIEATLRSGSLITARLAGEQGREVVAVPGNPLDPRARGTNRLIRDGATLVECADDVLEVLSEIGGGTAGSEPDAPRFLNAPSIPEVEDQALDMAREAIIALLGAAPTGVDEIVRNSGYPAQQVALIFMELELAGRLQRHPGGQVSLAFD